MFKLQRQRPPLASPPLPYLDILFLDELDGGERDEVDTFMPVPTIPRAGETVTLDGDFRRCGAYVVERVEYVYCCERRSNGWVRDLGVFVRLFVREH